MKLLLTLLSLLPALSAFAQVPCPFDERDYLAYNPDVQAAVFRGDFRDGYQHYLIAGVREGRAFNRQCGPMPTTKYCPFNEQEYLNFNPDVAAAVYKGYFSSGRQHFVASGYRENRILSNVCARDGRGRGNGGNNGGGNNGGGNNGGNGGHHGNNGGNGGGNQPCQFNEADYLAFNPDVLAAVLRGNFSSGYDHYARAGINEGRAFNYYCGPISKTPYCPFVEREYLAYNQDVAAAVYTGAIASGTQHFISSGFQEHRILSNRCAEETRRGNGKY